MKKSIVFLLLISLNANAQFVKKNGQLKVVGTQLVNKNKEPIVLRGMSFGWHCFHPRFYNKQSVAWLKKDWHCNVVRAALGVEPGDNSYLKQSNEGKSKIKAVIDGAIQQDIYVIVDWHSHNINLKEAKEFFAEISKEVN